MSTNHMAVKIGATVEMVEPESILQLTQFDISNSIHFRYHFVTNET